MEPNPSSNQGPSPDEPQYQDIALDTDRKRDPHAELLTGSSVFGKEAASHAASLSQASPATHAVPPNGSTADSGCTPAPALPSGSCQKLGNYEALKTLKAQMRDRPGYEGGDIDSSEVATMMEENEKKFPEEMRTRMGVYRSFSLSDSDVLIDSVRYEAQERFSRLWLSRFDRGYAYIICAVSQVALGQHLSYHDLYTLTYVLGTGYGAYKCENYSTFVLLAGTIPTALGFLSPWRRLVAPMFYLSMSSVLGWAGLKTVPHWDMTRKVGSLELEDKALGSLGSRESEDDRVYLRLQFEDYDTVEITENDAHNTFKAFLIRSNIGDPGDPTLSQPHVSLANRLPGPRKGDLLPRTESTARIDPESTKLKSPTLNYPIVMSACAYSCFSSRRVTGREGARAKSEELKLKFEVQVVLMDPPNQPPSSTEHQYEDIELSDLVPTVSKEDAKVELPPGPFIFSQEDTDFTRDIVRPLLFSSAACGLAVAGITRYARCPAKRFYGRLGLISATGLWAVQRQWNYETIKKIKAQTTDPDTREVWTVWAYMGLTRMKMEEKGMDPIKEDEAEIAEHERQLPEGMNKFIAQERFKFWTRLWLSRFDRNYATFMCIAGENKLGQRLSDEDFYKVTYIIGTGDKCHVCIGMGILSLAAGTVSAMVGIISPWRRLVAPMFYLSMSGVLSWVVLSSAPRWDVVRTVDSLEDKALVARVLRRASSP
ncbi:hypothetical protein EIP91_010405 [Steccherinum ochraceum]|uniref:Uncharacterized protein n=1 Tax=Steccherinum ochraceum TaxID=92696 RepID=A0A4R0R8K5_9APHY|nr:hypothetical protein EIP91_010405 [Steccherinum ochraceum]